jgi:hypothetical protein
MWLQKTGFAACLILLACGTSAQDKPANGVAAVRAANKLIDKNFTVARNTSFGDLITPENVLQTLRVSALFSPLSVTAVARVIAVDPNSGEIHLLATMQWQDRDLVDYKTDRDKDQLLNLSEARDDLWISYYQSYCGSYYYYYNYYDDCCFDYSGYYYQRALNHLDRQSSRVSKQINKRANARKDFVETVILDLTYSGPLSAREIIDSNKLSIVMLPTDVDLRPGIPEIDVPAAVGILVADLVEITDAKQAGKAHAALVMDLAEFKRPTLHSGAWKARPPQRKASSKGGLLEPLIK